MPVNHVPNHIATLVKGAPVVIQQAAQQTAAAELLHNVSNTIDQPANGHLIKLPEDQRVLTEAMRGVSHIRNEIPNIEIALQNESINEPLSPRDELKNKLGTFDAALLNKEANKEGYVDLESAYFHDVLTAEATMVEAVDGVQLPANRMPINGVNMAIATQYPKAEFLESHFKMLMANRTPVLVVLASQAEIDTIREPNPMPAYFEQDAQYGSVAVEAQKQDQKDINGLIVQNYQLKLQASGNEFDLPVIHVTNWADCTAITVDQALQLVEIVNQVKSKRCDELQKMSEPLANDKLLPVVHCRAGVGRTGQLIATMSLVNHTFDKKKYSVESTIEDMRTSRNHFMAHTSSQLDTVCDTAEKLGQPLLEMPISHAGIRTFVSVTECRIL